MRHRVLPILLAMAIVLSWALMLSCQQQPEKPREGEVTAEDVKKEVSEAVETTKAYLAEQKKKYVEEMETELADYRRRIDELQKKAEEATGEAKADMEKQIEKLREKQEAARKKLDELEKSGEKAWEDLKAGANKAMEDLEKAFEEAKSHFEAE